jgi:hypothetical protein
MQMKRICASMVRDNQLFKETPVVERDVHRRVDKSPSLDPKLLFSHLHNLFIQDNIDIFGSPVCPKWNLPLSVKMPCSELVLSVFLNDLKICVAYTR